ncbi:hypothetical protein EYC80_010199 [Monilinia laxa]|uniref:Uncharacterized protein n=1 Tax=Monilinia laxa TaxID=61186 RepID=A0A5N6JLT0_MONLA|nr:hypothetical protein EYC80_010199 [Monilinia laxa]
MAPPILLFRAVESGLLEDQAALWVPEKELIGRTGGYSNTGEAILQPLGIRVQRTLQVQRDAFWGSYSPGR